MTQRPANGRTPKHQPPCRSQAVRNSQPSTSLRTRRATVLICVLACLAIVAALAALTLRSTLQAQAEAKTAHRLVQTEWLLDAGISHARRSVQASTGDYAGELIRLGPDELAGHSGRLTIEVQSSAENEKFDTSTALIVVTAEVWNETNVNENLTSSAQAKQKVLTQASNFDIDAAPSRIQRSYRFLIKSDP